MKKNSRNKNLKAAPELRISDPQVIDLWVRAGGRCELHGCNDYLLQDKLTTNKAKLGDIAHIVARSKGGPRGDDPLPLSRRNDIGNLFLACPKHHREIDNKALEGKYPKELLLEYKRAHEERVKFVTGLSEERETTVIRLIGKIRGSSVSISNEEIRDAVLKSSLHYPRYLGSESKIEIDLTALSEIDLMRYWADGCQRIKDVVDRLVAPALDKKEVKHLSIFAFARIPFLAYVGLAIGDKIPLEIFQKQRSGKEGWVWDKINHGYEFMSGKIREGTDQSRVAIILSLSGDVPAEQLPSSITNEFTLYSIKPRGVAPGRNIMRSKESLSNFRATYANLLRQVETGHPSANEIHVFPAAPISAAVVLGREMLSGVTPSIVIYDAINKTFERAITLNSNGTRKDG